MRGTRFLQSRENSQLGFSLGCRPVQKPGRRGGASLHAKRRTLEAFSPSQQHQQQHLKVAGLPPLRRIPGGCGGWELRSPNAPRSSTATLTSRPRSSLFFPFPFFKFFYFFKFFPLLFQFSLCPPFLPLSPRPSSPARAVSK